MSDDAELILVRREGRIAEVRFNRPAKLNALNAALVAAATETLSEYADGRETAVIVLRGEGRVFSAGADVNEMRRLDTKSARMFISRLHELMDVIRRLPQIVIASVHGHCYGGAMEIAAACDIRIAAADARFGMPEIRIGLPSVIEAALLVPLIGLGRAADIVLTGEPLDAVQAERIGFVSRLAPPAYLEQMTRTLALQIAAFSGPALRLQKELVRSWYGDAYDRAIERGIDVFAQAFASPNPAEAIDAFIEKRQPRFSDS